MFPTFYSRYGVNGSDVALKLSLRLSDVGTYFSSAKGGRWECSGSFESWNMTVCRRKAGQVSSKRAAVLIRNGCRCSEARSASKSEVLNPHGTWTFSVPLDFFLCCKCCAAKGELNVRVRLSVCVRAFSSSVGLSYCPLQMYLRYFGLLLFLLLLLWSLQVRE